MTFYNTNIRVLEIEPTSYCNAKCPHCVRESRNGDYSFFKQVHLTKDFFEIYLPVDFIKNLKILAVSGNIGEPAMNKDLLNILRYFRSINPDLYLEIYTNGSVQSVDWWIELGNIVGNKGNVIFAIDGLEDTNHIYRIDVKWKKLIENAVAYNSTNSNSTWQFIPFKHNQHQVEQAELMSKELGFKQFKLKITHRHLIGQPQNIHNQVEPADDPRFVLSNMPINLKYMDKTEKYLDSVNINCYAIEHSNLYIDATGRVFPCCHTASIPLLEDNLTPEPYSWISKAKQDLDYSEINLYNNQLHEIILSKTFTTMKNSWTLPMSNGRNPICAIICGKCATENSLKDNLLGS